MIPFPILSSTGVQSRPVLKQFAAAFSGEVAFFVDVSGKLYSFGFNQYGALGTGTTDSSYNKWNLVRDDVEKVYCGRVGTVVQLKNGKFFRVGSPSIELGASSSFVPSTTWTEIPFLAGRNVQDLYVGNQFILALIDGLLWGSGMNSGGVMNGITFVPSGSVLPGWTQLSDIEFSSIKLTGEYQGTGIKKGTNTLYAWGQNSGKWIDATKAESSMMPLTLIYAMSTNLILTAYLPHKSGIKMSGWNTNNNGYAMYGQGWNYEYEFGTRSQGSYSTVSDIGNYYPMKPDSRPTLRYKYSPMDTILYTQFPAANNAFYICGTQQYGQLSTGNNSVFQGVTTNVAARNAAGLLEIQYHADCVFYIYADGIYFSGRTVGLSTSTSLQYNNSNRQTPYLNFPELASFSFV